MKYKTRSAAEKFWNKVDQRCPMDCWEWKGGVSGNGYGNFNNIRSHRFAYEYRNGAIPEGMYVCHHCDNKLCCNPNHLFLGTALDNMKDKINKGRTGDVGRSRKTTCHLDELIRHIYFSGLLNQNHIANVLQVDQAVISRILNHSKGGENSGRSARK